MNNDWQKSYKNISVNRTMIQLATKECECAGFPSCKDGICLVYAMNYECRLHPCVARCPNRNFFRGKGLQLEVKNTHRTGWGLYTNKCIPIGKFIIEYVGEVIDLVEFEHRFNRLMRNLYFAKLDDEFFIDATECGNIARFANHSCQPNAHLIKWMSHTDGHDHLRLGLVACRNILAV